MYNENNWLSIIKSTKKLNIEQFVRQNKAGGLLI